MDADVSGGYNILTGFVGWLESNIDLNENDTIINQ